MGTSTVRPDATPQAGLFTVVGAATLHAAVNDAAGTAGDKDTTYVEASASAYDAGTGAIFDLPTPTVPAGAKITGVRVRMRARDNSSWPFSSLVRARPRLANAAGSYANGAGVSSNWGQTTMSYYAGAYETKNPHGVDWTTADLAALRVLCTAQTDNFGSGGRIAEVWVDVQYDQRPVVTVTAPAEGSTIATPGPTVSASYSDPEGAAVTAYQVKIFTSAQYSAGGFSPDTSAALLDSGWLSSNANPYSYVAPSILGNGTFRAYVRARQAWSGSGTHESAWDFNQFTVNITPTPTPTLAAAADAANSRVNLTATRGGTTPATSFFDFEFSSDGGATWVPVRGGTGVAISGTQATAQDYEVVFNVARSYRVRAWRLESGTRVESAWSATATATVAESRWWLKVPGVPTLNRKVRLEGDAFAHDSEEPSHVMWPLGGRYPVIVTGTIQGERYSLTFVFASEADYLAFEAIRDLQVVVYLASGRNWAKYLKFTGGRATEEDRTAGDQAPWLYGVTVSALEQDRPA